MSGAAFATSNTTSGASVGLDKTDGGARSARAMESVPGERQVELTSVAIGIVCRCGQNCPFDGKREFPAPLAPGRPMIDGTAHATCRLPPPWPVDEAGRVVCGREHAVGAMTTAAYQARQECAGIASDAGTVCGCSRCRYTPTSDRLKEDDKGLRSKRTVESMAADYNYIEALTLYRRGLLANSRVSFVPILRWPGVIKIRASRHLVLSGVATASHRLNGTGSRRP